MSGLEDRRQRRLLPTEERPHPTHAVAARQGKQLDACREFPFWNKQKLGGIKERREVERLVCLRLIVEGAGNWHDWRKR